MCDYSIHVERTRQAALGDKLVTFHFDTGTVGFVEDGACGGPVAVCLRAGTELAFAEPATLGLAPLRWFSWLRADVKKRGRTARFRRVDVESLVRHHDALEFESGEIVLLTHLTPGQQATVLQLPIDWTCTDLAGNRWRGGGERLTPSEPAEFALPEDEDLVA